MPHRRCALQTGSSSAAAVIMCRLLVVHASSGSTADGFMICFMCDRLRRLQLATGRRWACAAGGALSASPDCAWQQFAEGSIVSSRGYIEVVVRSVEARRHGVHRGHLRESGVGNLQGVWSTEARSLRELAALLALL